MIYAEESPAMWKLQAEGKTALVFKGEELLGACILVDDEKKVAYKMDLVSGEIHRVEGIELRVVDEYERRRINDIHKAEILKRVRGIPRDVTMFDEVQDFPEKK